MQERGGAGSLVWKNCLNSLSASKAYKDGVILEDMKRGIGKVLFFLVIAVGILVCIGVGIPVTGALDITTPQPLQKADAFLDRGVNLPPALQTLAQIILGADEGQYLSFRVFIILLVLWIALFLLFGNALDMALPFSSRWLSWAIAALLVIIGSAFGVLRFFTNAILSVSDKLFQAYDWGILDILFVLLLIGIIWVVCFWLISKMRRVLEGPREIAEARARGIETGMSSKAVSE